MRSGGGLTWGAERPVMVGAAGAAGVVSAAARRVKDEIRRVRVKSIVAGWGGRFG